MSAQGELDFSSNRQSPGLDDWREARRKAQRELARSLGLPLGHRVEVRLTNGIRLRGDLRLSKEMLFTEGQSTHRLHLQVEGTDFTAGEIESCVRLD